MTTAQASLRKGWCPGALRPMETGDGLLVRVRPRAGQFSIAALKVIAGTATRYGSGEIDLTNRANLQLRGLSGVTWPGAIAELNAAGLLDETAAIEAVRNVTVDPLCGIDPQRANLRPLAAVLEVRLAQDTLLHSLPGKFGFGFSGVRAASDQMATDINICAHDQDTCAIWLNGDASRHAVIGHTDAIDATVRLAAAFLNIQSQHANVRRMRDAVALIGSPALFAAAGLECFREKCERFSRQEARPNKELGSFHDSTRTGTTLEAVTAAGTPGANDPSYAGILGDGTSPFAVGIGLPFGRIAAEALQNLCDLSAHLGCTQVHPSQHRTLVIPVHDRAAAVALIAHARDANLITHEGDPRHAMDVCPGAPACRNGTANTRADAQRLAAEFGASGSLMPTIHISGCEKGCARHTPATLTFVARDGAYAMIANGPVDGHATLAGIAPQDLAATAIRWLAERAP
ncbi:MAG: precorrin-3B synthase [Hyphomicrobium sp.]